MTTLEVVLCCVLSFLFGMVASGLMILHGQLPSAKAEGL